MIITLKAAASGQPGRGELSVPGWKGGETALEVTVRRSQDGRYLDSDGTWSSTPVWHALQGLAFAKDTLTGEVGPWLVDPLLLDHRMTYEVQLRDGVVSDKGVLRISGTILSSLAAGNPQGGEGRDKPVIHAPEKVPFEEVQEPEEIIALRDEPREERTPPRRWWPWAVLAACGVFAAVLVGYFYWPFTATQAPEHLAQCSSEVLKQSSDDMAFIQACLKTKPSSEQVLEVIARAKEAGRCELATRLYAYQGQAGDADVALAYARELDPKTFTPGGCIKEADAETAAYWYEIVESRNGKNLEVKQRLEELRKK
ncbi:hypothetical protein [Pseudomonas neuropathica]|uniref:Uncharacterized protein n=1 Tax=Pseudomonas neuropathica TaxID=2730425 RepID=A0ACC7N1V4_9PSED